MHLIRIFIRTIVWFAALLLLHSCGASHSIQDETIHKEADFTYPKLKGNDVAIAGVSSEEIILTDLERMDYGSLLAAVLIEKLPGVQGIKIRNPQQLSDSLGKVNYISIMKEIDVEKKILSEAVEFIHESIPSLEFLILAYIENENVIDRSERELIINEQGEEEYETEYKKNYFLTVSFQIYNVPEGKNVWETKLFNEALRSETRTTDTGCFESCISGAISNIFWGEPAEIDRMEMLSKIFEKYAEILSQQ